MSSTLILALILFGIVLICITLYTVVKGLIPVKYSVVWIFAGLVVLLTGMFPSLFDLISNIVDIKTISNIIIAIMITLLLLISLSLTIIVSKQKKIIKILVQDVSILKSVLKKEKGDK